MQLSVVNRSYSAKCELCAAILKGRLGSRADPTSHDWRLSFMFTLIYNEESVNKMRYQYVVFVLVWTPGYGYACRNVVLISLGLDSSK